MGCVRVGYGICVSLLLYDLIWCELGCDAERLKVIMQERVEALGEDIICKYNTMLLQTSI